MSICLINVIRKILLCNIPPLIIYISMANLILKWYMHPTSPLSLDFLSLLEMSWTSLSKILSRSSFPFKGPSMSSLSLCTTFMLYDWVLVNSLVEFYCWDLNFFHWRPEIPFTFSEFLRAYLYFLPACAPSPSYLPFPLLESTNQHYLFWLDLRNYLLGCVVLLFLCFVTPLFSWLCCCGKCCFLFTQGPLCQVFLAARKGTGTFL